jgi:hypothetical protein
VLVYHLNLYSFYCDYFYQATSTRYAIRGSNTNFGFATGNFSIALNGFYSTAHWGYGAALSFKPFSSFYCDYFYQTNGINYSIRGDHSNHGNFCGIFCLYIGSTYSLNTWSTGASLSFKPVILCVFYCDYFYQTATTHYAVRGGNCVNIFNCGFAYVGLYYSFSNTSWGIGTNLSFKPSLLFYF